MKRTTLPLLLLLTGLLVGCKKTPVTTPAMPTNGPEPTNGSTPIQPTQNKTLSARVTFKPSFADVQDAEGYATYMALAPNGQKIVVVAQAPRNAKNARVIDLSNQQAIASFESTAEDLGFASDGGAVIHQNRGVTVHPLNGGKDIDWVGAAGYRLEIASNGKYAATANTGSNKFFVWDATTGKQLYAKETMADALPALSNFFDNGQKLATAAKGVITVWNAADGTPVKTLDTNGKLATCTNSWLAVSSDGRYIAGCNDSLCVFEIATGRLVYEGAKESIPLNRWRTGFRPGSHLFAFPMKDNSVALIDIPSGQTRFTLVGHTNYASHVLFPTDGKSVVTMSGFGEISIWDLP